MRVAETPESYGSHGVSVKAPRRRCQRAGREGDLSRPVPAHLPARRTARRGEARLTLSRAAPKIGRMRDAAGFPAYAGENFRHQTERGELDLWLVAPSVLVVDFRGYSDASFMAFIEAVWARTLEGATGPLRVFGDTEHQT